MRSLQADPVRDLEPIGDPWIGILYPSIALAVSIGLSYFLYWYFVRKRAHEEP